MKIKQLIFCIFHAPFILLFFSCEKNYYSSKYDDYIFSLRAVNDSIIVNIAYSEINDNCPINTIEHFKSAVEIGFNALKTDIRITDDGKLVLCHDPGFTLNEKKHIIRYNGKNDRFIRYMQESEVLMLEHEACYDYLGYHANPTTLNEFLKICKNNNIIPYITVRNEYVEETVVELKRLLELYNLKDRAIINNYPPSIKTCQIVREHLPYIAICFTTGADIKINKEIIETVDALGNAMLCVQRERLNEMSDELWLYAMEKDIRIYGCEINDKEEYNSFIAKGCKGFQILKKEVIEK